MISQSEYTAQLYDTAYRAASLISEQLRTWQPITGSAMRDYGVGEQNTIISRSRDAYRNQPLARAAIERLEQTVVGRGISLQSKIDYEYLGISKADAERYEKEIERLFEHWANHCDYERQLNFSQIEQLVMLNWLQSGDVFINTPYDFSDNCLLGLRLQVIEADRVSNPNMSFDVDNLRRGIEFDEKSRVVAYHVMSRHPYDDVIGDQQWIWERIAAFNNWSRRFLHVWKKERPGQVRGIPFLAPVLEPLNQLDRYTEAELQASVISALLTVFVKSEGTQSGLSPGYTSTEETKLNDNEIGLKPGAIVDLMPGEDIATVNPARPNRAFQAFVEAAYKQIGAALGIPMESLLLRYDSSYSAARAAISAGWKKIIQLRDIFISNFCMPVYANFFDEVVARKLIDHPSLAEYFSNPLVRASWQRSTWNGPAKGAIDEEKEIRAAKDRVDLGVSSLQIECDEMGTGDWIDILSQRETEHKMRAAAGLEPEVLAKVTSDGKFEGEEQGQAQIGGEDEPE